MTRTLILMRHTKSGWRQPLEDHERPLNTRGRNSAKLLGDWMRTHDIRPDQVLCSTAKRTVETCNYLELETDATFERGLYHASSVDILHHLSKATGQRVLLIGHNPGIGELAEALSIEPPAHPRFHDYPTGASLVLEFDMMDWINISRIRGKVVHFVIPREL